MSILAKTDPLTNLGNARIGYKNILNATTTTEAAAMLIPNTYERYRPTAGSKTVKFQMGTIAEVDFVAIAAHNAGRSGVYLLLGWAMVGAAYLVGTVDVCIPSYTFRLFIGYPPKRETG